MTHKNYYEILGIKPGAKAQEIKQAFRELARRFHPDSGGAESSEEIFQSILQAYEVLSNVDERKKYDEEHAEDLKSRAQATYDKEQKKQTATYSKFGKTSASMKVQQRPSASALFQAIPRSLKEIFTTKAADPIQQKKRDIPQDPRGDRIYQFTVDALESIRGTHRELAIQGYESPRIVRVKIPAGVIPGTFLNIQLSEKEGKPAETVKVRVNIVAHPLLDREGLDIILKIPLTLSEAVNGAEFDVPSLTSPVRIKIPPGWDLEKRLRIKGRGLEGPAGAGSGDLYIKCHIALPENINESLREKLEQAESLYSSPPRSKIPRYLVE
jgi:DnaJ-class molecular chaperone